MKPFLSPRTVGLSVSASLIVFLCSSSAAAATAIVEESFLSDDYGGGDTPLHNTGSLQPGLGANWKVTNLGQLSNTFSPRFVAEGLAYESFNGKKLKTAGGAARLQMEPGMTGIWNAQRALEFSGDSPLAAFSSGGEFADKGRLFVSFLIEAWTKNAPFQSTFVLSDSSELRNSVSVTAGFVNSTEFAIRADMGNSGDSKGVIDRFGVTVPKGTPVLVVLCINFDEPGGAKIQGWVNPNIGEGMPAADGEISLKESGFRFDRFVLRSISGGLPDEIYGCFDEIRFGPTFESVTPTE